jgi:hypothetical protein
MEDPIRQRRECKTSSDLVQVWKSFIPSISWPNFLDLSISSSLYSSGGTVGTPNTIHRVFAGEALDTVISAHADELLGSDDGSDDELDVIDSDEEDGDHPNEGNEDEEDRDDVDSDEEHHHNRVIKEHTCHRRLQDQTAPQIHEGDAPNATFVCPVCGDVFDPKLPVYQFYRHMDKPLHHAYVASHGIMCEFECGQGFLDEHHQFMHYATRVCPSMQRHLGPVSFTCLTQVIQSCRTRKKVEFNIYFRAYKHWTTYHAKMAYTTPGIPKCTICKFGLQTKAMLISHLQQCYSHPKNETYNVHASNMLKLGLLWKVDLKHISNPIFRNMPNRRRTLLYNILSYRRTLQATTCLVLYLFHFLM